MKRIGVLTVGTRLGAAAVEHIAEGRTGVLLGLQGRNIAATPLDEVVARRKALDPALVELGRVLAR